MDERRPELANFASALKRARRGAGVSQDELAAAVGVSRPTVSTWETGRAVPGADRLAKVESRLGLHDGELSSELRPTGGVKVPAIGVASDVAKRRAGAFTRGAEVRYASGSSGTTRDFDRSEYAQMLMDVAAAAGAHGLRPDVLNAKTDPLDASVAVNDSGGRLVAVVIAEPVTRDDLWRLDKAIRSAERSAFRVQHQVPGAAVIVYFAGDGLENLERKVQLLIDTGVTVVVDTDQLRDALATTTGGS